MGIIKGKFMYLTGSASGSNFDLKSYSTSHSLSISADTEEVAHKTDGAGFWTSAEVNKLSWLATSESLYIEDGAIPQIGSEVTVTLCYDKGAKITAAGTQAGTATTVYNGTAIVTNIDINAEVGSNASYSITLTGKGALNVGAPSSSTSSGTGE